jgi:hypothetical protein
MSNCLYEPAALEVLVLDAFLHWWREVNENWIVVKRRLERSVVDSLLLLSKICSNQALKLLLLNREEFSSTMWNFPHG